MGLLEHCTKSVLVDELYTCDAEAVAPYVSGAMEQLRGTSTDVPAGVTSVRTEAKSLTAAIAPATAAAMEAPMHVRAPPARTIIYSRVPPSSVRSSTSERGVPSRTASAVRSSISVANTVTSAAESAATGVHHILTHLYFCADPSKCSAARTKPLNAGDVTQLLALHCRFCLCSCSSSTYGFGVGVPGKVCR